MSISRRKKGSKTQYRFVVSYTDADGKYKQKASKWFDTSAQAKKAEAEFRRNDLKSMHSRGDTFGDVLEEVIESKAPNVSPAYLADDIRLGDIYLGVLKPQKIQNLQTEDFKKVTSGKRFQGLSTGRKNRICRLASSVLTYAEENYSIYCPAKIPHFQPTDEERLKEMTILTPEQFQVFHDALPEKHRGFFYVLYWTGMRLGEAASLTFKDVQPDSIQVWHQYDVKYRMWRTIKNRKRRKIAITPEIYEVFETQRKKYQTEFPDEFSEDWFCFGGATRLWNAQYEKVKTQAMKKTDLPHFRVHDLRHSHASYLIEKGVNIYKISRRLGHSSITMTIDRYGHLMDTEEDEILAAMSEKCQKP